MKNHERKNWLISAVRRNGRLAYYWVRVFKRRDIVASKTFLRSAYGTAREALLAAREWRDAQVRKHGVRPGHRAEWCEKNRRNWTGEIGVALNLDRRSDRGVRLDWKAMAGTRQVASVAINTHGCKVGWYKAVVERRKALGLPLNDLPPPPSKQRVSAFIRKRLGPNWREKLSHDWPIP